MKKEKRVLFMCILFFITFSFPLPGSAFSAGEKNRSLQWFPAFAVDDDTVYVVWADERNGNYTRIMNNQPHKAGDVYISRGSLQNGWIFEKNIRVNDVQGSTGHGSPSIAVDNATIYVLWEEDRFGLEELYFSTSPKHAIMFPRGLPVVAEPGSQVLPSLSVLKGTAYIAMMNKQNWDIMFSEGRSVNGIYRFDKPVRVNDDPAGNWHYAPSLAVDDEETVCMAWLDARNGDYDIFFSHGIRENGTWRFSKNVRVNDDPMGASQYTPSIEFENGRVYAVWYDDRNKDFDIYFTAGGLENNSWRFDNSIRVNDDTGKSNQMHPDIAVREGELFAVWEDERDGASNIYVSKSIRKNGSFEFSENVRVNDISGRHYDPQIEISKDSVYVVWQAEVNDGGDIYFSQGKYNGNHLEFGRSIQVNDDRTDSFTRPSPVFLGILLGAVLFSVVLVSLFRGKVRHER